VGLGIDGHWDRQILHLRRPGRAGSAAEILEAVGGRVVKAVLVPAIADAVRIDQTDGLIGPVCIPQRDSQVDHVALHGERRAAEHEVEHLT